MPMLEKLLFPSLMGKWKSNINLNKYAKMLHGDMDWNDVFTINPFLDPNLFGEWINLLHKTLGVDYSYGGWMEDREEILDGTYLESGHKIHLGVDYWVPVHTSVYLPKTGKLVSSRYDSDTNGGWGGQVIFEIDGLFVIFGHLTAIIPNEAIGQTMNAGHFVGLVADVDGSGGWYPHLHLQCMKTFEPTIDGYGAKDPFRFDNFPNPEDAIHI
jgi:hypothetical protein